MAERNQTDIAILNTTLSVLLDSLDISGERHEDGWVLRLEGEYLVDDDGNTPLFKTASEIVGYFGDRYLGLQELDELTLDELEVDDFVGLADGVGIKDYADRWENVESVTKPSVNSFMPFTATEWRDVLVKMAEVTNYKVEDMDNPYHKLLNVLLNSDMYSDGSSLGGLLIMSELLADQSGLDLSLVFAA